MIELSKTQRRKTVQLTPISNASDTLPARLTTTTDTAQPAKLGPLRKNPLNRHANHHRQNLNKTPKDWKHTFQTQTDSLARSLSAMFGLSVLFSQAPAIITGAIIGLFLINWLDGLNDGAKLILVALSILAAKIIIETLKRPQVITGSIVGLAITYWIDGLNTGAKLITIAVCILLAVLSHHLLRHFFKKRDNRHGYHPQK